MPWLDLVQPCLNLDRCHFIIHVLMLFHVSNVSRSWSGLGLFVLRSKLFVRLSPLSVYRARTTRLTFCIAIDHFGTSNTYTSEVKRHVTQHNTIWQLHLDIRIIKHIWIYELDQKSHMSQLSHNRSSHMDETQVLSNLVFHILIKKWLGSHRCLKKSGRKRRCSCVFF